MCVCLVVALVFDLDIYFAYTVQGQITIPLAALPADEQQHSACAAFLVSAFAQHPAVHFIGLTQK